MTIPPDQFLMWVVLAIYGFILGHLLNTVHDLKHPIDPIEPPSPQKSWTQAQSKSEPTAKKFKPRYVNDATAYAIERQLQDAEEQQRPRF